MAKKKKESATPIEAVKHRDKRANIPTEELRDFVAEDEKKPKTILYPRDPSLDPQLVWNGKDEQDQKSLSVISVKSRLDRKDLCDGLRNLQTITPIELKFRQFQPVHGNQKAVPPITKYLVTYMTKRPPINIQKDVSEYYKATFEKELDLVAPLVKVYSEINAFDPSDNDQFLISRLLPRMIATLDTNGPGDTKRLLSPCGRGWERGTHHLSPSPTPPIKGGYNHK